MNNRDAIERVAEALARRRKLKADEVFIAAGIVKPSPTRTAMAVSYRGTASRPTTSSTHPRGLRTISDPVKRKMVCP